MPGNWRRNPFDQPDLMHVAANAAPGKPRWAALNLDEKVHIPRMDVERGFSGVGSMKITAQEEYGLRCLLRLARAPDGSLTLPEIADAEGLSVPHVAKLMAVLRHAGL